MKRPYFDQMDRLSIRLGTLIGENLMLNLAWLKLIRSIQKAIKKEWYE